MNGVSFDPAKDISDLSGQVIIVTGGNAGLGLETVRQLAKHNPARLYLAGRSEQKVLEAIHALKEEQPNAPISPLLIDLASFASVKAAAKVFVDSESRLDILINNAGCMMLAPGLTEDGYEIQFGTNVLGPALFTQLLLPVLQKTAEINSQTRVVNLSSASEKMAPKHPYPFEQLKTTMENYHTTSRYTLSKLAVVHYTIAAAQHYTKIKFISVHPGMVATNLHHQAIGRFLRPFLYSAIWLFAAPPEEGVLSQIWAAVSPDARSGEYYAPVGRTGDRSPASLDMERSEKLWTWIQGELEEHLPQGAGQ
ncbi:putative oxidoreductase [Pseudocercospora fuligena]|uniref:Putative oxidoreductase n=1 Tax=Pseudocercospora fuligena TaxID=685502 RepID=A0A8H6VKU3_9PEZI|nr:putative oxidoreductase [Pseudocercospora fuligena]